MSKVVYTAHSKKNFYARKIISAFVLIKGGVPLNPFMNFGYFLDDLVDRDKVRKANNVMIDKSDELWQFGAISNGCYHEILLAIKQGEMVRFFTVSGKISEIKPIKKVSELEFEDELRKEVDIDAFCKILESVI